MSCPATRKAHARSRELRLSGPSQGVTTCASKPTNIFSTLHLSTRQQLFAGQANSTFAWQLKRRRHAIHLLLICCLCCSLRKL
ncbi:uncharacterized protein TrAFT101_006105 [Trichoderma asperellum]|uniref:uncharacterized protein n=1 Tax=Trichoderma asperellum TaxID=101201 RepID=UPI00332CF4EE|nr:hypothetical protein TrAFT101_006105 [Trichoderma asperellum]